MSRRPAVLDKVSEQLIVRLDVKDVVRRFTPNPLPEGSDSLTVKQDGERRKGSVAEDDAGPGSRAFRPGSAGHDLLEEAALETHWNASRITSARERRSELLRTLGPFARITLRGIEGARELGVAALLHLADNAQGGALLRRPAVTRGRSLLYLLAHEPTRWRITGVPVGPYERVIRSQRTGEHMRIDAI